MYWVSKFLVEFHDVKGNQFVQLKGSFDDGFYFVWEQAVGDSGACARHESWVKSVHVETDVDGSVQFPDEVNCLADSQVSDVFLLDRPAFEIIDVSDAHVRQILERKLFETHARDPMHFFDSRANWEWGSMFVAGHGGLIGVDVRVGINPDNMHVLVFLVWGHHWRTGNRMVPTN